MTEPIQPLSTEQPTQPAQGPVGPRGEKGERGESGQVGETGQPGVPGARGEPGPAGKDGSSGQPGPAGPAGAGGVPGAPGRDGKDGADGQPGQPGPAGRDGKPGKDGMAGMPGRDGKAGPAGPAGVPGKDGRDGRDVAPQAFVSAQEFAKVQQVVVNLQAAIAQLRQELASVKAMTDDSGAGEQGDWVNGRPPYEIVKAAALRRRFDYEISGSSIIIIKNGELQWSDHDYETIADTNVTIPGGDGVYYVGVAWDGTDLSFPTPSTDKNSFKSDSSVFRTWLYAVTRSGSYLAVTDRGHEGLLELDASLG